MLGKVFTITLLTLALPASAAPSKQTWQRVHLGSGGGYDFPLYANHDLQQPLPLVREVILVQHGIQRNGDAYFAEALTLLQAAGRNNEEVLIIAPNFPAKADLAKGFTDLPLWSSAGWSGGDYAVSGSAYELSSMSVYDDVLTMLTQKKQFPALKKITVAGHSGGGQLVQRYAVLNQVDETVRQHGIALSYIVANPSSFLYFTAERPSEHGFVNYDTSLCPAYDQYRYGMQAMVAYAHQISGAAAFERYRQRKVTYLAGTADNDPQHRVLDKSCGAEAEGATRIARAHNYWQYEQYLAGARSLQQHQRYEVIGVGHNQSKMFGSQCGSQLLFGVPRADGAACRMISSDNNTNQQASTDRPAQTNTTGTMSNPAATPP